MFLTMFCILGTNAATQLEINSMAIVGDFLGLEATEGDENPNWNPVNGWAMTQDAENPAIWLFSKKAVEVEGKKYEYKATANGVWGDYELPSEGNQNWEFGTDEYPAGKYDLTFIADTEHNTLTLEVVKTTYLLSFQFRNNANWNNVFAYAWSGKGENVVEILGKWPGTKMMENDEGVYYISTEVAELPNYVIFSNGVSGIYAAKTNDLRYVNGKTYEYAAPVNAQDVFIYPVGGDIAAALEEAKAQVVDEGKTVGNITVNLAVDGVYTIGSTLTVPNSLFFYGNDATVSVDEEMTGNLITLAGTEIFAKKADGTESDHKIIQNIEVRGVTIKGLKGALVKDTQKTLVEKVVIDHANIKIPATTKNVLDFNAMGYVGKAEITNSTIWASDKNTGFFAQYGSRPKNVDPDELQEFEFVNSTIVNIAKEKNFNDLKQNGTAKNAYTIKNSIFVNCGKNGQTVIGMNKGQVNATPFWEVDGNYFEWGGECTNNSEVSKAGVQDGKDIVKNCVEGKLTFTDAANGDFNGEFALAEGAVAPEALGAPDWTITFATEEVEPVYTVAGAVKPNKYASDDEQTASFFGEMWAADLADNDMTWDEEKGVYTKTFNDVSLQSLNVIYYKVVKNHSWDESWGFGKANADYVLNNNDGLYDVTFTFSPDKAVDPTGTYNVTCVAVNKNMPDFDYDKTAIDPAAGSVESLHTFMLTFGGQEVIVNANAMAELVNENDEVVNGTMVLTSEGVKITLEQEVSTPGNYVLNIPENTLVYNGTSLNPLTFKYQVAGGSATKYTIDPVEGEVESLSSFTITFNNDFVELKDEAMLSYLLNTSTNEMIGVSFIDVIGGSTKIYLQLEREVSVAGEYELHILGVVNSFDMSDMNLKAFKYTVNPSTDVYAIVGDFSGGWPDEGGYDLAMTQSTDDPDVYTLVIENFVAEAKEYAYKLRLNGNWDEYELPGPNENYYYKFTEAGTYNLTFTANVSEGWVTLEVEKVMVDYKVSFVNTQGWNEVWAYAWYADGTPVVEWPGTKLKWGYEQYKLNGEWYNVFPFTFQAYTAPARILFSNGKGQNEGGIQTPDLDFVNGQTYVINDDEMIVTGINGINTRIAEGAAVYNMQGIRVDKAHKGLYIVDGKKVVVK